MMTSYSYQFEVKMIKNIKGKSRLFKSRVSRKTVSHFTRDLSIMLNAKMHLVDSITILSKQINNEYFKQILSSISNHLKGGISFSDCLGSYPRLFNNLYVQLVKVGEVTGRLDEMLNRISLYLEKIADLKRKTVQAFTYPMLVIAVAILSLSFILFYVIPTFSSIFKNFDSELPWLTQLIFNFSNWLKNNIPFIILILPGIVFLLHRVKNEPKVQIVFNYMILNLPIIGNIVRKNHISQFCRTLGTLLGSGVSLLEALDVTAKASNNYYVKQDINNMKYFVSKGEKLTHSLDQSAIFPLMVSQMIAVGEETAELPFMLVKIADHYDKEIDSAIEMLSSVIEPVVIVLLGIIIGTILISIYLPLFNISNIIQ
jgi:type IV pilus assembly protein PilC